MTWPAGTRLLPTVVDIQVSPIDDHLTHVGIGYHIEAGGAIVTEGGFTWHSPDGDHAHALAAQVAPLRGVIKALLAACRSEVLPKFPAGAQLVVVMITLHLDGSFVVRYRVQLPTGGLTSEQSWNWQGPQGPIGTFLARITRAAEVGAGV